MRRTVWLDWREREASSLGGKRRVVGHTDHFYVREPNLQENVGQFSDGVVVVFP